MSKKKAVLLGVVMIVILALNVLIWNRPSVDFDDLILYMTIESELSDNVQVYYTAGEVFDEDNSQIQYYNSEDGEVRMKFPVTSTLQKLRLDLGNQVGNWTIKEMYYKYNSHRVDVDFEEFSHAMDQGNILGVSYEKNGELTIETGGMDSYITIQADQELKDLSSYVSSFVQKKNLILNIIAILVLDLAFVFIFKFRNKILALPIELLQNRQLILNLAKNDFKTKFAGSYLGIVWAFIQPVVTILVYWFVFQVGFRSGAVGDTPFVLYLIAGIVPWFYFQDTLNSGTNALLEYNYLVKKVVFKISVLPMVKAISALFVHAFFILVALIIFTCYGYMPDLYELQIVYYFFAMFVFSLGICYGTCAIVGFFRDLTQIISIVLQIGVWTIPIMWNIDVVPVTMQWIFKVNPMYYIVTGYRDALINKVWFWQRFDMTLYFWACTAVCFGLGTIIFKRLKVHFADVL